MWGQLFLTHIIKETGIVVPTLMSLSEIHYIGSGLHQSRFFIAYLGNLEMNGDRKNFLLYCYLHGCDIFILVKFIFVVLFFDLFIWLLVCKPRANHQLSDNIEQAALRLKTEGALTLTVYIAIDVKLIYFEVSTRYLRDGQSPLSLRGHS